MKKLENTKLIIPNDFLEKYDLDLSALMLLFLVKQQINIVNLKAQLAYAGYITIQNDNTTVTTELGELIIKDLWEFNNLIPKPENIDLLELAKEMQSIFPSGLKPGTNNTWRGNKYEIQQKLVKFQEKFNLELDREAILTATKAYVNSFNQNYKTMHTLKYFILKHVNVGGEMELKSELLSFLDNDIQESDNLLDDDYLSKLL